MKKLTYEEWYFGNITLKYAKSVYNEDSTPKLVSWIDFSDEDIIEIKKKQKEIFREIVKLKLDKLKVHFEEIYSRSQIKCELLEMEKQECINILYSPIPRAEKIVFKNWKVVFDIDDLLEIQNYFKNSILGGNDGGFDFVQSPNDIYQDKSKTLPQAYAQTLFSYFQWLEDRFKEAHNNLDQVLENDTKRIDKTKMLWFQVGLLFANGEIDRLIIKHKAGNVANFTAISKELGNKSFRPYISESISDIKENDKNIFSSKNKISSIIEYCESKGIPIVESFKDRIKKDN